MPCPGFIPTADGFAHFPLPPTSTVLTEYEQFASRTNAPVMGVTMQRNRGKYPSLTASDP